MPQIFFPGLAPLAALAVLFGCAAAPASVPGPLEPSFSMMDSADAAVLKTWGRFLPSPENWAPRVRLSSPEGNEVEYLQRLPVSSLCYFPRFAPGLEEALAGAGFTILASEISRPPARSVLHLLLKAGPGLRYRFEFDQEIKGRLALIIDDVGYTQSGRDLLLALDYPLTLAILPRLPHSLAWNRLARRHGYEIFLHFPLEAVNPAADIGPGGLLRSATAAEIRETLDRNLATVPDAVGVNNHMGSAFTSDPAAMRIFLEELRRRDLFFVDSLTVAFTATRDVAPGVGIPYAVRDIFLDHENTEESIIRQFNRTRDLASREGRAVAIGHYRRLTLETLGRLIPDLEADGLQVVPASDLVR